MSFMSVHANSCLTYLQCFHVRLYVGYRFQAGHLFNYSPRWLKVTASHSNMIMSKGLAVFKSTESYWMTLVVTNGKLYNCSTWMLWWKVLANCTFTCCMMPGEKCCWYVCQKSYFFKHINKLKGGKKVKRSNADFEVMCLLPTLEEQNKQCYDFCRVICYP